MYLSKTEVSDQQHKQLTRIFKKVKSRKEKSALTRKKITTAAKIEKHERHF